MATTQSGIWYPGPADPITPIENVFSTMAQSIETTLGMRLFATTTARDAAYSSVPFKMCVVGTSYDAGTWYIRENGVWIAFDPTNPPVTFGATRLTASNNLNSLNITGWYDWINNSMPINAPEVSASSGFLTHRNLNAGQFMIQDAYVPTTNSWHHWTREYVTTWSAWSGDAGYTYGHWTASGGTNDLTSGNFIEKIMATTLYQVGGLALSSGRIVAPFTGKYLVTLNGCVFTNSTQGMKQLVLGINNATDTQIYVVTGGSTVSAPWYANASGIVALNATDRVSMFLYQSTGAPLSSGNAHITMQYIGA